MLGGCFPLEITFLLSRGKRKEGKKEGRTTPIGNYITTIPWQKEGRKERRKKMTKSEHHYANVFSTL